LGPPRQADPKTPVMEKPPPPGAAPRDRSPTATATRQTTAAAVPPPVPAATPRIRLMGTGSDVNRSGPLSPRPTPQSAPSPLPPRKGASLKTPGKGGKGLLIFIAVVALAAVVGGIIVIFYSGVWEPSRQAVYPTGGDNAGPNQWRRICRDEREIDQVGAGSNRERKSQGPALQGIQRPRKSRTVDRDLGPAA
jgi:hypothetical protein